MKEEIQYLENKIRANRSDIEQLRKKGNRDLSRILDDETRTLKSILTFLQNIKSG